MSFFTISFSSILQFCKENTQNCHINLPLSISKLLGFDLVMVDFGIRAEGFDRSIRVQLCKTLRYLDVLWVRTFTLPNKNWLTFGD